MQQYEPASIQTLRHQYDIVSQARPNLRAGRYRLEMISARGISSNTVVLTSFTAGAYHLQSITPCA